MSTWSFKYFFYPHPLNIGSILESFTQLSFLECAAHTFWLSQSICQPNFVPQDNDTELVAFVVYIASFVTVMFIECGVLPKKEKHQPTHSIRLYFHYPTSVKFWNSIIIMFVLFLSLGWYSKSITEKKGRCITGGSSQYLRIYLNKRIHNEGCFSLRLINIHQLIQ